MLASGAAASGPCRTEWHPARTSAASQRFQSLKTPTALARQRWQPPTPGMHPGIQQALCRHGSLNGQRQQRSISQAALPLASLTAARAATAAAAAPASSLPALITSLGVLIAACAAALLMLCAIPTLWQLNRTAKRLEAVLQVVEAELPDTAASMRLSGLELSDCLDEVSAFSTELTSGVRASARMLSVTEQTLRQAPGAVAQVVTGGVVPVLARKERSARDALETALQRRASLSDYSLPVLQDVVRGTAKNAKRARAALMMTNLAGIAWGAGQALRGVVQESAEAQLRQRQQRQRQQRQAQEQMREQLGA